MEFQQSDLEPIYWFSHESYLAVLWTAQISCENQYPYTFWHKETIYYFAVGIQGHSSFFGRASGHVCACFIDSIVKKEVAIKAIASPIKKK